MPGEGRTFFEADTQLPESSSPDGKSFPPKALAFWARKAEARKSRHHCGRCAKPNTNGLRQCDACRAYMADYRASKRTQPVTVDAAELARLERRIANLEHYFAQLSTLQRVAYKQGYVAGRKVRAARQERASYHDALHGKSISHEELADINHAYTRTP